MRQTPRGAPRGPGIVLGMGLGGLADGIVLHQILQWHHVLSGTGRHPATTVRGLEANTLWDGWFHAASWVLVVVGVALLWRRGQARRGGRALLAWVLVGWGLFNVVEGLVDHHILGIHHVRPGPDRLAYDVGFLVVGAALIAGGGLLSRSRTAD